MKMKATLNLVVVVLSITIWVMLCIGAWAANPTLDVANGDSDDYSTFLTPLRDALKEGSSAVFYGIPMIPAPTTSPRYILADLKLADNKIITLAINRNNLYVVGYAKNDGTNNVQANFFPDAPSNAKTSLFTDVAQANVLTINFESSYTGSKGIESKAGTTRQKLGLGTQLLKGYMIEVYDKPISVEKQARFLLIAIQMVAEAARFKYIEEQVIAYFYEYKFEPDDKILILENNWGTISSAIQKAIQGNISPPLTLTSTSVTTTWTVSTVAEIGPYISLLNYVATTTNTPYTSLILTCGLVMLIGKWFYA